MFPAYSYVPGRFPHPIREPGGHSFGTRPDEVPAPIADRWRECSTYLHGIQLFNRGYYWEAHEAWEAVWNACGRRGLMADFFKGLIKLAAAGVKAREGNPDGVRRHADRGRQLLQTVVQALAPRSDYYFGLDLPLLVEQARTLAVQAEQVVNTSDQPIVVVMPFQLEPSDPPPVCPPVEAD